MMTKAIPEWLCCVGLTGVDDYTDFQSLKELYIQYPFCEFGVCFDKPESNNICYAGYRLLKKIQQTPDLPWVAHLSEKNSRVLLESLKENRLPKYLQGVHWKRLQINYETVKAGDFLNQKLLDRIHQLSSNFEQPFSIILPESKKTRSYFKKLQIPSRIDILNDESGGRGVSLPLFERPLPYHSRFGYAGGIGIHNLQELLPYLECLIQSASMMNPNTLGPDTFYWIDMESSLKTVNRVFDIKRAEAVLFTIACINRLNPIK